MNFPITRLPQKPVGDKESHFYLRFVAGETEVLTYRVIQHQDVGTEEEATSPSSRSTWLFLSQPAFSMTERLKAILFNKYWLLLAFWFLKYLNSLLW